MRTVAQIRNAIPASAVLLIAAASLAAQKAALPVAMQPVTAAQASTSQPEPQLEPRYPRYVVQREDVLLVGFPLSPELNQTVSVQPDGFINLQGAASLHVQGMTAPDIAEAVKQAYQGTLNHPIVTVDVQDFQKPFFTVTGQVGKPGQYELRSDITVAEAIAVAGGLEATAKTQVFLFHRASDAWFKVEKLNLKEVLDGKHADEDSVLKPGDMVFVPENAITKFRKYVPYGFNAGSYLAENQ